ncbi:TPA: restriction endonuclease [Escherichia coli]|nr:restriction endonuclease [Escherichia coli]
MLPSETMIWQPEFTDKTLSRKPGAVHPAPVSRHSRMTSSHWRISRGDSFLALN